MDITIDGFDEFLRSMDIAPDVLADEIEEGMHVSLDTFEQAVVTETPVGASGNLRAATATEIFGTRLELGGRVVNPLIYGWPVEVGRKAGKMPPVAAIELWVVRKLGIQPPESRQVAFLVARAIGRRGTKGAHMFLRGFLEAEPRVVEYWEDLPGRVLERL